MALAQAKASIDKDKSSKDRRNKAVSIASKAMKNMLSPAAQVANLLDGVGAIFPPCKTASNILTVSTLWDPGFVYSLSSML